MSRVSDAVLIFDADERLIYSNPAAEQLFGFAQPVAVSSITFSSLFIDQTQPRRLIARLRCVTQLPHQEYRLLRQDGSARPFAALVSLMGFFDAHGKLARIEAICRGITQQHEIEAELYASEERLRSIVNATHDGLLVVDPESGRFRFVNDSFCRMLGYSRGELLTLSVHDIHPPSVVPLALNDFQNHANGLTDFTVEMPVKRKDGSEFVADIRSSHLTLDGKHHVLGVFRDVTDRIKARESERHRAIIMKAAQQIAQLGYWVWDMPTRTFSWSEELQHMLGEVGIVRPSYVSWLKHIPKRDRYRFKAAIRAVFKGLARDFELDHAIDAGDGSRRVVHTRAEVVLDRNGSIQSLIGSVLDITERAQAQARLEESEQRFREYTEIAADWWSELGPDLRFTYLSPNVKEVLGIDPRDVIGKRRVEYHSNLEDVDTPEWKRHVETLRHHEPYEDFVVQWRHPDGGVHYLSLTGRPRFDADGRFLGYRGVGRDITKLTESQRRAERLRALLDDAFDSISDGLLLFDADDRLVLCNSAYRRNAGPIEHLLKPGLTLDDLAWAVVRAGLIVVPAGEEQDWVERRMMRHRRRERYPFTIELPGNRWHEVVEYPTQEGGTLILRSDITERVRVEQALRRSEARFERAIHGSEVGILDWDHVSRTLYLSPGFKRLLGYGENEMEDFHFKNWLHPDDRDRVMAAVAHSFRSGAAVDAEYRLPHKRGGYRWFHGRGKTYLDEDGKAVHFTGMITDITARRRAQEALIESEARFRQIFDSAPLGIAITTMDKEYRYVAVNPAFCAMVGYRKEELEGKTVWDITYPEDIGTNRDHASQVLIGEAQQYAFEKRYVCKDGRVIWGYLSASVLRDAEGRGIAMLGMTEDITAKKETEGRLNRLLGENKQLARYAIAAREKERKHLARELHDELGQLMTAIKIDAELLTRVGVATPREAGDAIADISLQTERAHATIRDMTHRLHPLELDHLGLVDTLRQEIRRWGQRNADIHCEFTVRGAFDDLNERLVLDLYRIIQESLTNIVRYAGANHVEIALIREARAQGGDAQTEQPGCHARSAPEVIHLTVRDNGRGMDPEHTTLGLGLLGMRERIESHNGRFELRSKSGEGVALSAWIPIGGRGFRKM